MPTDVDRGIGLLGAGGQARELASYCERAILFQAVEPAYVQAGSDVLSLPDVPEELLKCEVLVATGAPGLKRDLVKLWKGRQFATVVASDATVARTATLGRGVVIAPGARVMAGVVVGDHVLVNTGAIVSHDCELGSFVTISPGAALGGACKISEGVFVGIGATIRDGVSVGAGAVIGAGAVVLSDVNENEVVVGVPARKIRQAEGWLLQI